MSGRPLTLSWENERFDAILEAWHGGTMAGYALADVLFGDARTVGQTDRDLPAERRPTPARTTTR